ncbi:protein DOWNY MILDEW RESISTANCE 6-like [Spinacia oleracea]|uniref:Protein DOWNY MILDEW RESISTANCE 6-like n=1 Tax=Spinacia oleracea TaxID=3562 RepID=A0ABM3RNC5_SPIOL|nr:protein DOWNY MILDEW RESISTANCE 6-like [Spinacia oleracea]
MKPIAPAFQWADVNEYSSSSNLEKYTVPVNHRPNFQTISHDPIPTIDMSEKDNSLLVQNITNACKEFGFFQVINHGVKRELCDRVLDVITTFFELSYKEKTVLVAKDHMEDGKIYKYSVDDTVEGKEIPMWSEALFHHWHPVDHGYTLKLPEKPDRYRYISF